MLATGTTLGCGLSLVIAVFPNATEAAEAKTYHFGEQTVIVRPGPVAAPLPAQSAATVTPVSMEASRSLPVQPAVYQLPEAPQPEAGVQPTAAVEAPPAQAAEHAAEAYTPQHHATNAVDPWSRVELYREIYNTIPFSRAEYDANPSYRHEATMELLLGQLRTSHHQRTTTNININGGGGLYGGGYYGPWLPVYNRFHGGAYWAPGYRSPAGGYFRW